MTPEDKVTLLLSLSANAMARTHRYPLIISREYKELFNEFYEFYEAQLNARLEQISPSDDKHDK